MDILFIPLFICLFLQIISFSFKSHTRVTTPKLWRKPPFYLINNHMVRAVVNMIFDKIVNPSPADTTDPF